MSIKWAVYTLMVKKGEGQDVTERLQHLWTNHFSQNDSEIKKFLPDDVVQAIESVKPEPKEPTRPQKRANIAKASVGPVTDGSASAKRVRFRRKEGAQRQAAPAQAAPAATDAD